ncbi:MAG: Shedu anti-phage system protein SduA domain-containing protein [Candidatus Bathyarchaeia archaeon]|jgi:hypothetical protein
MNKALIERGMQITDELAAILRQISDREVGDLLGTGALGNLLKAILDPRKVKDYPNIAEFLLANKTRATLLAMMRYAITSNYSFKAGTPGKEGLVSPHFVQWYEDGVMLLEGQEPFAGLICLYRNNELRYAVAGRDARGGEKMGKEDFEFLTIEESRQRIKTIPPVQISDLEKPIRDLKELLADGEVNEAPYQKLIQEYPWILGAQYDSVQDHTKLDNANIPDFSGVRVRDKHRDIIEIKSPFIQVLRKDGELSSEFNEAWNQCERYLDFAKEEKEYLRRKGFSFDNPRCYLIIGHQLSEEALRKIRVKEKMNPTIEVLTYDGLAAFASRTVQWINGLQGKT